MKRQVRNKIDGKDLKKKVTKPTENPELTRIKKTVNNNGYKSYIGIDVGVRNLVAGVSRSYDKRKIIERNFKFTSYHFYKATDRKYRNKRQKWYTDKFERKCASNYKRLEFFKLFREKHKAKATTFKALSQAELEQYEDELLHFVIKPLLLPSKKNSQYRKYLNFKIMNCT